MNLYIEQNGKRVGVFSVTWMPRKGGTIRLPGVSGKVVSIKHDVDHGSKPDWHSHHHKYTCTVVIEGA